MPTPPLVSRPALPGRPAGGPPRVIRPAGVAPVRRSRNPLKRWWQRATDPRRSGLARAWTVVAGVIGAGLAAGALGAVALGVYAASLVARTPDAFALSEATRAQPSIVYAASGERLTQFEAPFQEWVPLDSIPGPLVDALIATEDRRFYEHGGVDVRRTVGALWATVKGRREGGSTVTQQLARNLFPREIGNVSTPERKIKEMIAAVRIERDHTKREILESYLNTVPFLYNAHGVEMAARTYFGTHAPALTATQAATLIAMLKGPAEYNPVRHPDAALQRRNLVLTLMEGQNMLTPAEAAEDRQRPLGVTLRPQPGTYSAAPHFTAAVRRAVEAWAVPRGYDVERDGLVIRTTLQMSAQHAAEAAVSERAGRLQGTADREWRGGPPRAAMDAALEATPAFARAREDGQDADAALRTVREDDDLVQAVRTRVLRVESALVAIEPATGAVRAYVGSRDFTDDEFDHAGVARRQPGSTFKAFVYASALQRGYAPDDEIEGGAAAVRLDDGTTWRPSGGSSGGTLRDALAFSKNAVAVRLTQEVGPHRVALVAQRMGITSPLDVVPSIGLGTSPVTLLEMVGAYGAIANDGLVRTPRLVTRIETASGQTLATFAPEGPQALTRRDARQPAGHDARRRRPRHRHRPARDGRHRRPRRQDGHHAALRRRLVYRDAPGPRRRRVGRLQRPARRLPLDGDGRRQRDGAAGRRGVPAARPGQPAGRRASPARPSTTTPTPRTRPTARRRPRRTSRATPPSQTGRRPRTTTRRPRRRSRPSSAPRRTDRACARTSARRTAGRADRQT